MEIKLRTSDVNTAKSRERKELNTEVVHITQSSTTQLYINILGVVSVLG